MSFESESRTIGALPRPRAGLGGAAAPSGTTAVLNAANEVAVAAFLDRRIRFDQIHGVNVATLEAVTASNPGGWTICWRWTRCPARPRTTPSRGWPAVMDEAIAC